jgi:hypothetical protein
MDNYIFAMGKINTRRIQKAASVVKRIYPVQLNPKTQM